MNAGHYTIKSFFTYQNLEQVLIPEIQRDYVWKTENIRKLLQSIMDDFTTQAGTDAVLTVEYISNLPSSIREEVLRAREKQKAISNIGFIYAYYDVEQHTKYILIDGQQRMTSIFLILMCLYIKEGKISQFKKIYFPNDRPKMDYKVRENAHVFLLELITYLLNGNSVETVKDQYWYFSIYKQDATINSILNNYQAIVTFLDGKDLTVDYVENFVEFWYFDTAKSEQGEDLYLYMNSRGESVQTNENIKAELLEPKSESEKHTWGSRWEDWQNTFWLNKGKSPNADRGFDEFLRWIKIINTVSNVSFAKNIDLTDRIREIRENKKFGTDGLSLEIIESYYNAVERLLKLEFGRYFDASFLSDEPTVLSYIRLLPLLMYAEQNPQATRLELLRFGRYFYNITRFDIISKSPYQHIGQVIILTHDFLAKKYKDVTDLTEFKVDGLYENVITPEELQKLFLYSNHGPEISREELEGLFWKAEDFALCDGKISIIWHCMDFQPFVKNKDTFSKDLFNSYFETFKLLFTSPSDLVRRAMLTKGDYSIQVGNSSSLQAERWAFGSGNPNWRSILDTDGNDEVLRLLLSDYIDRAGKSGATADRDILNAIISEYLAKDKETNWHHEFISNYKILQYCSDKLVCFIDQSFENIYLLEGKKAVENGYVSLSQFLKNNK
jgi:uncharacterized protein with ParB-like and HNH nuclease domain